MPIYSKKCRHCYLSDSRSYYSYHSFRFSDDEDAEVRVAEYLNMAIGLDSDNFDAYSGLTTYLKTIGQAT